MATDPAGAGGVGGLGALSRLWRDVYQKAGAVAEARTRELLRHHVYQYPHGAGGEAGPAGGGLVELGRAVATAGQQNLRVPASGPLPTGYSGLWLTAVGRNNDANPAQNETVFLFFNDQLGGGVYHFGYVQGTPASGAVGAAGDTSASAIEVGLAPALNAAEPTVWSLSGSVPLHEGTVFPKTGLFVSAGMRTRAEMPLPRTTTGVYGPTPAGPITSVTLRLLDGWRAGATLVVYGHPDPA